MESWNSRSLILTLLPMFILDTSYSMEAGMSSELTTQSTKGLTGYRYPFLFSAGHASWPMMETGTLTLTACPGGHRCRETLRHWEVTGWKEKDRMIALGVRPPPKVVPSALRDDQADQPGLCVLAGVPPQKPLDLGVLQRQVDCAHALRVPNWHEDRGNEALRAQPLYVILVGRAPRHGLEPAHVYFRFADLGAQPSKAVDLLPLLREPSVLFGLRVLAMLVWPGGSCPRPCVVDLVRLSTS